MTCEAAIESSYQDNYNRYLKFLKKKVTCKVKVRSKVKNRIFGFSATDSGLSIAAGPKSP